MEQRHVLVVDDESFIVNMVFQILGMSERVASCTIAGSGEEARGHIERRQRGEGPMFDMVLSDVRMPGMSGVELHRVARSMLGDSTLFL